MIRSCTWRRYARQRGKVEVQEMRFGAVIDTIGGAVLTFGR